MEEEKRRMRYEPEEPADDVGTAEKLTFLNMALESAGIGTWVFDLAGNKIYFDDTSSRILGFKDVRCNRTKKEFLDRIHTDDRVRVSKVFFNSGKKRVDIDTDLKAVWENGTVRFLIAKAKVITNVKGFPVRLIGLLLDITEQKHTENELKSSLKQLQQTAHHIEEVREKERLSISRELHDDLGQALTAVKIDLSAIKQNVTDMATVLLLNRASALVSDTIKKVQSLTSQLRPQIIDDLGLETAIEWYTKEFEQRSRISIILDLVCDVKIPSDDSLIIFRILQEALTNIARYSGATTAKIMLGKKGRNIVFSISDNGVGITEDKLNSGQSFGIIGMKERAAALGGTLKIFRDDNQFTVVSLIFPLKQMTDENSDL
jgi:two-component system sensor histidine kinase UhpB